jgi:hypothetical protein
MNAERRARNLYFRLLLSRLESSSARRKGQASRDNGPRSDFNWFGILEYNQYVSAVFPKTAVGELEYDESTDA